jgi:uncharacterized protein (UPF0335 family)
MMSDLTYRLRNGFGSICGRASQVDGYQTISNEAADKIEELEKERKDLIEEFAGAECMGDLAKIARNYGYEAKALKEKDNG